ncbi:N-acetylneuraminate synthase family protein [Candidatus Pelagibacter sp.]|nr:N-acetylneuraminate synthase family protein [Candidatus Pelagibacter sp.]
MTKNKTFIIAEIGVNHNGSVKKAKKLILSAKKNNADAVKFQSFSADRLAFKHTPKVKYQKKNSKNNESHYQMLKKLEFSEAQQLELINFCKRKKIEFISTPFDVEDAKILVKQGIKKFKTSSADLTDFFLHNFLSKNAREVIISTGMSNLKEISNTLKVYKKKTKITLLHCVSNYPCSDSSLNLNNIITLQNTFKLPIGFSDHSNNKLAPITAMGLGCRVIERHVTLNKRMRGPDHLASDNPTQFKRYVKLIRNNEKILGDFEKKKQKEEIEMHSISRKGIYYSKDKKKGEKVNLNNLFLRRPWGGLSIFDIKKVIKNRLLKDVKKNEKVKINDFKN